MARALTIGSESGELLSRARQLKVLRTLRSRERRRLAVPSLRLRHDRRAVDEVGAAVAEDGELSHGKTEGLGHELLLVDEALPEASSALVASEGKVRLETELADISAVGEGERGRDLAGIVASSGEALTLEQDLEENLSVESERSL